MHQLTYTDELPQVYASLYTHLNPLDKKVWCFRKKTKSNKAENKFDLTQSKDASGLENVSNFLLSRVILKNVGRIENQRKIRMTSKGCNLIKVTEVALS